MRSDERFDQLTQGLRNIIRGLANHETTFARLITIQSEDVRQHVTADNERMWKKQVDERKYQEITQKLHFHQIYTRQQQVANNFDGLTSSFEWIFEETVATRSANGSQHDYRHTFLEWLRTGSGAYWINGKPGAGKSTLMNFICNHPQTQQHLKDWAGNKQLLVLKFFFWSDGVSEQKTIHGMLRSLIYQMLIQCKEMVYCFEVRSRP